MAIGLTVLFPAGASASWAPAGNPIASLFGLQVPFDLVPDGSGGALVFWFGVGADGQTVTTWAKRVRAEGGDAPGWPAVGKATSTGAATLWERVNAHPDGAGGALVAWAAVAGDSADAIMVQHVASDGGLSAPIAYDADSAALAIPVFPQDPGAPPFLAWTHRTSTFTGPRLLRLDAAGNPAGGWPANGVTLGGTRNEVTYQVVPDRDRGAYVLAVVHRGAVVDLYLYRADSAGVTQGWPEAGVPVRSDVQQANFGDYAMVPSEDGVIVVWAEKRSGTSDVYCLRFTNTGLPDPGWTASGVPAISAPLDQEFPRAVPDGAGGVFVACHDFSSNDTKLWANRVLVSGHVAAGWPLGGAPFRNALGTAVMDAMSSDGAGGFIAVWSDYRSDDGTIRAQRIRGDGTSHWIQDGLSICGAPGYRSSAFLAVDGAANFISVWLDTRSGTPLDINHYDVYGTRVTASGTVGVPGGISDLSLQTPRPNPTASVTSIWLEITRAQRIEARILDASGRTLRTLIRDLLPAGRTLLSWDGLDDDGRPVRQGIYFLQARGENGTTGTRIAVVK